MIADPTTLPFLLTVEEAADLLRIEVKTAYTRVARRQMPGVVRHGRRVGVLRDVLLKSLTKGAKP